MSTPYSRSKRTWAKWSEAVWSALAGKESRQSLGIVTSSVFYGSCAIMFRGTNRASTSSTSTSAKSYISEVKKLSMNSSVSRSKALAWADHVSSSKFALHSQEESQLMQAVCYTLGTRPVGKISKYADRSCPQTARTECRSHNLYLRRYM